MFKLVSTDVAWLFRFHPSISNDLMGILNRILTRGSTNQTLNITDHKITATPDILSTLNNVNSQPLQLEFIAEVTGTLTLI